MLFLPYRPTVYAILKFNGPVVKGVGVVIGRGRASM
jgi:hypothetical protein